MIVEKPNLYAVAEFLADNDDQPSLKGKSVDEIAGILSDRVLEVTKDMDFNDWPKFDDVPMAIWRGVTGLLSQASSKSAPCVMLYVLVRNEKYHTESSFSEIDLAAT